MTHPPATSPWKPGVFKDFAPKKERKLKEKKGGLLEVYKLAAVQNEAGDHPRK
jgi:hypothetical protein